MNYHTDIGNFKGRLLGRSVYERGVLTLKILLLEGHLLENGHTLDHLW